MATHYDHWQRVWLDEAEDALAHKWEDEILATGIDARENKTGFHSEGRYYHGYLGELALRKWSVENALAYSHKTSTLGRSQDGPEFKFILRSGGRATVDVKANAEYFDPPYMKVLAAGKKDAGYYVGALLEPRGWVVLAGWATLAEVLAAEQMDFGKGCPAHSLRFDQLHTMTEFHSIMRSRNERG